MVDFKGGSGVKVEVKKGSISYENDGRTVILKHGTILGDSGRVLLHNKDTRFLKVGIFERDALGHQTSSGELKVNPGMNRDIAAGYGIAAKDKVLKDGEWFDEDPLPEQQGGLDDKARAAEEAKEWLNDNLPYIVALCVLGGMAAVAVYYIHSRKAAAAAPTAPAPAPAPPAPAAPVAPAAPPVVVVT